MYARATRCNLGDQILKSILPRRPESVCFLRPRCWGQSLKRVVAQENGEESLALEALVDVPICNDRDNRGIWWQGKRMPWMGGIVPWLKSKLRVAVPTA